MPKVRHSYTAEHVRQVIRDKVLDKWVSAHDDDGHKYAHRATGRVVRSVTTKNITEKPHLVNWKINKAIEFLEANQRFERLATSEGDAIRRAALLAYRDIVTDASDVGTAGHNAIEEYINLWINTGLKPTDIKMFYIGNDYRVTAVIRSAEAFFAKYKFTPIATELVVGNPKESAGTLDLLVIDEVGRLIVLDWKSSNAIDDFYACQVAVYSSYFEKMTGLRVFKQYVVRLDKYSDRFKCYVVVDPRTSAKAFSYLSKYEEYHKSNKDKLKEDKVIIKI
jgi:hypothetical protein